MSLKWKSVKNMKSNPESIYTCSTCNNEVFCHVNYVNAEIYPCIRKQCGDATILSKKIRQEINIDCVNVIEMSL